MEVLINHTKIRNSPCEEIFSENRENILQLKQQLVNGNPICILVSGYRGTGKTSLVCQIENELKDANRVLFVNLSINKYEENNTILRRLVRNVYSAYKKKLDKNEIGKEEKEEIEQPLKLLYDRTFFSIKNNSSSKVVSESENVLTAKLNIKYLILILTTILTSLNLGYNFIPVISEFINPILFGGNIIWLVFEGIGWVKKKRRLKSKTEELCRETLYDDEIAEVKIKAILHKLRKYKYNVVIVIDELDKVEKDSEIELIISNLKPLMLSDTASFIIVSGQKLFYKYTSAKVIDDSLISSVFSKLIHVPILKIQTFKELFTSLVMDKKYQTNSVITNYLDSIILNSNRIVRRFYNLINEDILWSDNSAYIKIDEQDKEIHKADSKFLDVLLGIESEKISAMDYADGIKDYLIFNLYIWIQKIKLTGKRSFIKSEILSKNIVDDNSLYKNNLNWYSTVLAELLDNLLNKLVDEKLLDRYSEDEEAKYVLAEEIKIKKEEQFYADNYVIQATEDYKFYIEEIIREMFNDLAENYFYKDDEVRRYKDYNRRNGIEGMFTSLYNKKVISKNLYDRLYIIFNFTNEEKSIDEVGKNEIYSYSKVVNELYKFYIVFIIKKVISRFGLKLITAYKYREFNKNKFDFVVTSENAFSHDIVIEIKKIDYSSINRINLDLERTMNLIDELRYDRNKDIQYVLFYYFGRNEYNIDYRIIENEFGSRFFAENINVFNINEGGKFFNSKIIEDKLDWVISKSQR